MMLAAESQGLEVLSGLGKVVLRAKAGQVVGWWHFEWRRGRERLNKGQ